MRETTMREFVNERTGERCVRIDHKSGLPIFVWPKAGYASSYAAFATKYGSIDNVFEVNGKQTTVPAGIAHYLEHKLFENEDCDAFEKYAKTGASANAYTSFDRTVYLFSCTGDITPSLEILLDFVQSPYFTEASVQKEQGIIGQEIRMGEDSPFRRVLYNMLRGMYHRHPVNIEIAGTVESIAEITPELLYDCYHAFYNLHNMVLSVAGNVTPEQVIAVADRLLKPAPDHIVARSAVDEPADIVTDRVEEAMPVAAPLFCLGYKLPMTGTQCVDQTTSAAAEVLAELLTGTASPLYAKLMADGLINQSFEAEFFDGPGYAMWLFEGESRDPDAVAAAISEEIERLRREGVDEDDFVAARNALYGEMVAGLNSSVRCGEMLVSDYFYDREPFGALAAASSLQKSDVERLLAAGLDKTRSTLSIICPIK